MSVISFSLDRRSGEVGDTENVRLSQDILEGSFLWKAQGVGLGPHGFLGSPFVTVDSVVTWADSMASQAIMCDLERREETDYVSAERLCCDHLKNVQYDQGQEPAFQKHHR